MTHLALALGTVLAAVAAAPAAVETVMTPTKLTLSIPEQHPYLTLTPAEVAIARQRAQQSLWAKRALQQVVDEANGLCAKPFGALPQKGDTSHWGVAGNLFKVALAHGFTSERRYADWVRDGLVAYAAAYPGWPLTNLRCKAFTQSPLYEAMWLCDLVRAYDLCADSGAFTAAQRQQVETDLLRAAVVCFKVDDFAKDPRIKDLHYRCYNFQAWHLAAMGLVALAVRDTALLDYTVNSPYGLKHLIAHDIRDDGLFWERSPGYHQFVITALTPYLEACRRCGLDLWSLQVANQRHDEDGHYSTDRSDEPKSLRLMYEAPFYLMFPDSSYPALGDSDRGPRRGNWLDLVAWNRYRDPKLAWLLQRDVPVGGEAVTRGRVGFLHYYRHSYRYQDLRVNGQPVKWDRIDGGYRVTGDEVTIDDGGVSNADRWLLNDTDLGDVTFEWTMTRLANRGGEERSWLVYRTEARDPNNRMSFMLTGHCPAVGQVYRFRLEVRGETARLLRDGQLVSDRPTPYTRTPTWQWLLYDAPQAADVPASLPLAQGVFANSGWNSHGSSLLPATGVAMLRQADGDFTQRPDSTAVALSYGAYGGGHGHPDKLSLVVYALGRQWLPHFGSMPYETSWKTEWTAQTISHNTVVIDGQSQRPGKTTSQWPTDSAAERVVGVMEQFEAEEKRATAYCATAYPGLVLRRRVQVVDDLVVDDFAVVPRTKERDQPARQADYVLHIDGRLTGVAPALAPRSGALGTAFGYQHVQVQQAGPLSQVTSLTFSAGKQALRLWVVPTDESAAEVMVADGLTNSPQGRLPMLIVRKKAVAHRFVTVIEPVSPDNPIRAVRWERPAGQPPVITVERAQGRRQVSLG